MLRFTILDLDPDAVVDMWNFRRATEADGDALCCKLRVKTEAAHGRASHCVSRGFVCICVYCFLIVFLIFMVCF